MMIDSIALEQAKSRLIEDAKGFYQKNWMLGTAGNLSIKLDADPLTMVITASGKPKGELTSGDFVTLQYGEPILDNASGLKRSAETSLHEAIYKAFPDVGAVYHTHSVEVTAVSSVLPKETSFITFKDLEMIKGLGFETHDIEIKLPMVPNTQDIDGLSQQIADKLEARVPGLLLQGHGIYAWGKTPFEARRHMEIWQFLFAVKLEQLKLGLTP